MTPLIGLLGVAALMATTTMWLYTSSSPAKAAAGPQLPDVDGVYLVPNGDGTWDYVRLDYMMAPGTSDADAGAQAQADAEARFPGAIALDESGVSAAYVLSGFKWTAGTTSWSYDATGAPAGLTGDSAALNASAQAWGLAGANFHFTGGGPSSNGTGACSGGGLDGFNTVGWAVQSGSILAVTCSHFQNNGAAVEFDMQIDPGWTWTTGQTPNVDLQSVVTHEMGHALGLNHSNDSSAVMYYAYTQGTLKRSLAADDIAGEVAIYGSSGGGASPTPSPSPSNTPTNTPTPTKTATNTPTPTNTPTQPAGSPSPSNTPTNTPTQRPASTPTPTTPASPSASVTSSSTPTNTPSPTASPTPSPSPTPTATGTGAPPTLPLSPGANLLTWPGATSSPGTALAGELGAIRIIYQWDPATQSWLRYGPNLPSFVNNLSSLTQGKPYWFIATSAAQVPFVP